MAGNQVARVVNAHEHRFVRPCPVCGQIGGERIHEQHFVGYDRQDIMRCECGMIFADSGLTQFWYDEYYRERSKYHDNGGETVYDDPRRHAHTATYIAPFVNHSSRLLDFGCANGNLLKHLQDEGWSDLWGYDPSSASTAKAKAKGISIISTLACEQFSCIVMSHVLEHVYDVHGVMREVVGALRPGGVLYVEVPDVSRYKPYSPYQEFNIEHVNHFSLATLCSLAGRFGMVPLHVGQKTFSVGDGFELNASYGVFRKAEAPNVANYIAQSETKLQAIGERLEIKLAGVERVAVWGCGQLTLKLLALPCFLGRSLTLVDANPAIQGIRLLDRVVEAPEAIQPSDTIVVGSILNEKSIRRSIEEMGLANPVVTLS